MELSTFGVILKFSLDIENEVVRFYKTASNVVKEENLATIFEDLVVRGKKRIKILERVRRENVTEMILEPIIGFDSDSFNFSTEISENIDDNKLRTTAINLEAELQKFYTNAATKLDFLSEAAYAFELLAEKNEDTSKRLSG